MHRATKYHRCRPNEEERGLTSGELRQEPSTLSQHYYSASRLHVVRNHQRHTPPLSLLANPRTPDSILYSVPNQTSPPNTPPNVLIIICRVEDQLKARLRGSFRGANLIIYLFKTNCLGLIPPSVAFLKDSGRRMKWGDSNRVTLFPFQLRELKTAEMEVIFMFLNPSQMLKNEKIKIK